MIKTELDCFATSDSIICPHCYSVFSADDIFADEIISKKYGEVSDFKMKCTCAKCNREFYCYEVSLPEYTTTRIVDNKEILEWKDC